MSCSNVIIQKIFLGLICMMIFQGVEGNFSAVKAMSLRDEEATNQLKSEEVFQLNSNESSCSLTDPRCSTNGQL
ncbi:MAG: hypothetical protein K2Y08_05490 [Alphaproteobacteria bacterium]|nr:hypothetical protein [Alphaproteobacteria bacterium]